MEKGVGSYKMHQSPHQEKTWRPSRRRPWPGPWAGLGRWGFLGSMSAVCCEKPGRANSNQAFVQGLVNRFPRSLNTRLTNKNRLKSSPPFETQFDWSRRMQEPSRRKSASPDRSKSRSQSKSKILPQCDRREKIHRTKGKTAFFVL